MDRNINKIIVIPDSFKGTMSSIEVCEIMEYKLKYAFPECEIISIPIADGGEGTVSCFHKALGGELIGVTVHNAFGKNIDTSYCRIGNKAIIEMAAAAGMVYNGLRNPLTASTYGVGEMIEHAINSGCDEIIIGLGGSCSNDAGAGMAAALGTRFINSEGKEFVPTGSTLCQIAHIDNSELKRKLESVSVCCMCDVKSPLYGSEGAAYVFAPQKGASEEDVHLLDDNLRAFAKAVKDELGVDISNIPGGGAAGGMGAGCCSLLYAKLKPGIEMVLDTVSFDELLEGCDYVITGEGRIDMQSVQGKAISGIAGRTYKKNIPLIAVVGALQGDYAKLCDMGISEIYVSSEENMSFDKIKKYCRENLASAMDSVIADIKNAAVSSY